MWIFCRYAQYGDVSPKVDVYAFGVVLYELISAKNAVLKTGEFVAESKGLVALVSFHALNHSTEKHYQFTNLHLKDSEPNTSTWTEMKLPFTCFVLQFEEALNQSNPSEAIRKLVDPRLGENYPIDSVLKVEIFFCENNLKFHILHSLSWPKLSILIVWVADCATWESLYKG